MINIVHVILMVVLSCQLSTVSKGSYASQDPSQIYTTEAFFIPINTNAFGFTLNDKNNIELIASIEGMPDLPNWMNYLHPNGSQFAYLYGSPPDDDDGDIAIEIIAMNKYDYETSKDSMKFRITKREKIAKYEVELKFVNFNVEDMFVSDRIKHLWEIFHEKLWKGSDDVYITKIASPRDVGGRLPLDPLEKEGVIIRIGSTNNFTEDLLWLEAEVEPIKNRKTCPRKYTATSVEYMFRNKGFQSDWCSFHLIRPMNEILVQNTESKHETSGSRHPKQVLDDYIPLKQLFPTRNYTVDIMLCVVIPLLIGIMVISSLTCIFFYNKEEYQKESGDINVQLQQYNSIQRASHQLRALSLNRSYIPSNTSTLIRPTHANTANNAHTTAANTPSATLPTARIAAHTRTTTASSM